MKFKPLLAMKIPIAFGFIIFFVVTIFLVYGIFQFTGWALSFFLLIPGILLLMFLVFTIWLGLILYLLSKLELVFNSTTLELKSVPWMKKITPALYKSFVIEYKSIVKIKHWSVATVWEIIDEGGRSVLLTPYLFERNGGEGILAELRTYLPEHCFEDGFKVFKPRQQKGYWLKSGVAIALYAAFLFFLFFDESTILRSQLINAWKVEGKFSTFESSRKMLADSEGNIWVLSESIDQYSAYYWPISGDKKKIKLPKFQYQDSPRFVSGNKSGNPIVWLDNRVVYLDGEWRTVNYKNNLQFDFFDRTGIIKGGEAWTIVTGEDRLHLIHLYGLTGEWFDVALPESAVELGLEPVDTRPLPNGDFLVLMHDKEVTSFYVFSNDAWQAQEYSLLMNNTDLFLMDDVCLDLKGNLFLLTQDAHNSWVVKKISSTGVVDITHLPLPKTDEENDSYDEINIDAYGRFWVTGGYPFFVEVFQPQWGGTALELELYTRSNSNFQAEIRDSPILLADGRLLSADDYVSSIDTTLLDLPKPLPAWFANLDMQLIRIFVMMVLVIVNFSIMVKARKK